MENVILDQIAQADQRGQFTLLSEGPFLHVASHIHVVVKCSLRVIV